LAERIEEQHGIFTPQVVQRLAGNGRLKAGQFRIGSLPGFIGV
jgi:hypothetical protein